MYIWNWPFLGQCSLFHGWPGFFDLTIISTNFCYQCIVLLFYWNIIIKCFSSKTTIQLCSVFEATKVQGEVKMLVVRVDLNTTVFVKVDWACIEHSNIAQVQSMNRSSLSWNKKYIFYVTNSALSLYVIVVVILVSSCGCRCIVQLLHWIILLSSSLTTCRSLLLLPSYVLTCRRFMKWVAWHIQLHNKHCTIAIKVTRVMLTCLYCCCLACLCPGEVQVSFLPKTLTY